VGSLSSFAFRYAASDGHYALISEKISYIRRIVCQIHLILCYDAYHKTIRSQKRKLFVVELGESSYKALFALNVGSHPGTAPMASINHDFGLHEFSLCLS